MATISEQLRKAIVDAGISRYRISQETGIAESTLSRFVNGKAGLTMELADTLAEYLGLTLKAKGK